MGLFFNAYKMRINNAKCVYKMRIFLIFHNFYIEKEGTMGIKISDENLEKLFDLDLPNQMRSQDVFYIFMDSQKLLLNQVLI